MLRAKLHEVDDEDFKVKVAAACHKMAQNAMRNEQGVSKGSLKVVGHASFTRWLDGYDGRTRSFPLLNGYFVASREKHINLRRLLERAARLSFSLIHDPTTITVADPANYYHAGMVQCIVGVYLRSHDGASRKELQTLYEQSSKLLLVAATMNNEANVEKGEWLSSTETIITR